MRNINVMAIPGISHKTIEEIAAEIWDIDKERLVTNTRKREVVEARHVLIKYRKEFYGHSLKEAAKPYNKDHATALNSIRRVNEFNETDKIFKKAAASDCRSLLLYMD